MGRRKLDVLASSAEVANLADDAISYCLSCKRTRLKTFFSPGRACCAECLKRRRERQSEKRDIAKRQKKALEMGEAIVASARDAALVAAAQQNDQETDMTDMESVMMQAACQHQAALAAHRFQAAQQQAAINWESMQAQQGRPAALGAAMGAAMEAAMGTSGMRPGIMGAGRMGMNQAAVNGYLTAMGAGGAGLGGIVDPWSFVAKESSGPVGMYLGAAGMSGGHGAGGAAATPGGRGGGAKSVRGSKRGSKGVGAAASMGPGPRAGPVLGLDMEGGDTMAAAAVAAAATAAGMVGMPGQFQGAPMVGGLAGFMGAGVGRADQELAAAFFSSTHGGQGLQQQQPRATTAASMMESMRLRNMASFGYPNIGGIGAIGGMGGVMGGGLGAMGSLMGGGMGAMGALMGGGMGGMGAMGAMSRMGGMDRMSSMGSMGAFTGMGLTDQELAAAHAAAFYSSTTGVAAGGAFDGQGQPSPLQNRADADLALAAAAAASISQSSGGVQPPSIDPGIDPSGGGGSDSCLALLNTAHITPTGEPSEDDDDTAGHKVKHKNGEEEEDEDRDQDDPAPDPGLAPDPAPAPKGGSDPAPPLNDSDSDPEAEEAHGSAHRRPQAYAGATQAYVGAGAAQAHISAY